ncbi:tRNA/rRNA methyltransferase YsgA [Trypanosoma rangeli]|uniref:tRNA/rRNA methyltransferase YsgA n=1 Tax=Trypanosoma rangeli TaxID=5698 RepID=A0A422P2S4_TRYRA|nr:tRNA/rRNA methyltransferase YsgA [Trypanosoma rangeli]RNF12018.1 tRNA/rRNA methyltransferase YsgA [Trypanosoma rangeli]|eukprot:RNF12018.1 tRNA/rRNA methyltransferase YsgA [Trypanosoma rangeli]
MVGSSRLGMRHVRDCCGGVAANPSLLTLAAVTTTTTRIQYRWQSFFGEHRETARRSRQAHSHPLAPKDPAARNIVIPDTVHAKSSSPAALPAEVLQKRAQRALLRQLQQNLVWEGTVIDDERHDLIQHFVKLRQNPKYRSSKQMMILGGKDMLRELFEDGYTPRHLLIRGTQEVPSWTKTKGVKTEIVRVDRRVAEVCAPGNDGYIGDFDIPSPPAKENLIANKQRFDRILVLDNVDEPGLLGTLLRTAAGFHYDAIITTNHCADLYDHRVLRAARGAHFQKGVPIYILKDEDGDDVYGMLNHILKRNNMSTVCFTPVDDDVENKSNVKESTSVVSRSPTAHVGTVAREGLSDYCHRCFTNEEAKGQLLIAGPNHKRNSLRRWSKRLASPVTRLLLDEVTQTDLLVALSVVIHALRPHGNWDYLPTSETPDSHTATLELQTLKATVDIGADRLDLRETDLNLDEEEQVEKARLKNEFMRWKRLQRRKMSDYEHWMEAETQRVREMAANERRRQVMPWARLYWRHQKGAAGLPPSVPNIIDEYRMPLDRDALREEQEVSTSYVRPENYNR